MAKKANYSVNQVQEMIKKGVEKNGTLVSVHAAKRKYQPNHHAHSTPTPTLSNNNLTDVDLQKLMVILQTNSHPTGRSTHLLTPKIYTGIAQGVDPKGQPVAYCWSHG